MKVLIVDDQESNRQLLGWILEDLGHTYVEAENGLLGVAKFVEERPDLVLLDVMMPVMDGYEAAREIKKQSGDQYIPIIFLTAMSDEKALIKCLDSGGDDFLSKPVDEIVLQAKIRAHVRTQELNQQVRNKNEELTYLHNRLQHEHAMGEHVIANAMRDSLVDTGNVNQFVSPMSRFNGDLVLVAAKPTGGLYVFWGDFTGHGLAASIGAIPVSQAFFTMSQKSLPLTEMVRTINSSLVRFLPDHMFCAATLLEMNSAGTQIKVWCGGLPDAIIYRPEKGIVGTISSRNMPMGILDDNEFDDSFELLQLEHGDSILMYTDGVIEGLNAQGEMFGEERLHSLLGQGQTKLIERVMSSFQEFKAGLEQDDDISIVEVISAPVKDEIRDRLNVNKADLIPWEVRSVLGPDDLRVHSDPCAKIVDMLPKNQVYRYHRDIIRTLITELFSNSLEHGLLGLQSEIKRDEDGFVEYYRKREELLSNLSEGSIELCLSYDPMENPDILKITITDSGKGFDHASIKNSHSLENCFGRGIGLVNTLSHTLEYVGCGNQVVVHYNLKNTE